MNSQKVSVAMCTFNGEAYLVEQIESILDQTYSNIELVICDDGSSDGTLSILEDYAVKDPRITLILNTENLGFLKNFEKALGLCTGEYIALADQDDIWLPNKIEYLLDAIGSHSLVYSSVKLLNGKGVPLDTPFPGVRRLGGRCALSLVIDNCVTGHACLLRRDLLKKASPIPDNLKAHDQWLAVVSSLNGGLKSCDEVLSYYRQHADNVTLYNKNNRLRKRWRRKQSSDLTILNLGAAMLKLGMLDTKERYLLETFCELIKLNRTSFYNKQLEAFLMENEESFLGLYADSVKRKKVVERLCRGDRLLRYFPFV